MGRKEPRFVHSVTGIVRKHAPGFRRRHGGDASQPPGQVPERHLRGARHLARAARRALPGALRPPVGRDGAVTLVEDIVVRQLGRADYLPTWQAMRAFTRGRQESTPDELWLLEHPPVYTWGKAPSDSFAGEHGIPVVQDRSRRRDHLPRPGPGRALRLVDLARRAIKVKRFVWLLEQAVIDLLGAATRERKAGRAGRVRGRRQDRRARHPRGARPGLSWARAQRRHGPLAFQRDRPLRLPGLRVTQMRDLGHCRHRWISWLNR